MNFIDALPRARVPLDVAILWQRHTSELRTLSPVALRDAWRCACKRICVLRANLSLKAAHILLRSELKASDGEYVLPSPESEDLPSSNAMGTLSAAVNDAKFTADVARALVDLSDKLRAENSFDAARSLCVDRIKFILKLTDFAGCSALLDAEIKRVQNEPPDGGGARAVPLAPAADAVEEETLGGAGSLLASATKAERETFEVLRGKIARKHESYSIAVSFASRREELGSLRPLAKGLTVLRLQRVLGNEQDAEATLEGVVRHWDERMRRAA